MCLRKVETMGMFLNSPLGPLKLEYSLKAVPITLLFYLQSSIHVCQCKYENAGLYGLDVLRYHLNV